MIKFKIIGLDDLRRDVAKAADELPPEINQNVAKAAEIVLGAALENFKGERTHALYEIHGGKRRKREIPRPITSPPEMLGVFEGTYRKSITTSVQRLGKSTTAEIGPVGIRYAPVHEFGGGNNIPARPVLTPAVADTAERVFDLIGQSFRVIR